MFVNRIAPTIAFTLLAASAHAQTGPVATYSGDVGPLIEQKCVHCHRPGGIAPMPFMSYADVRDFAKRSYTPMDALLKTRAMPPWPANPAVGEFSNREFMTDAEIELLLRWIQAGYPRGDGGYEAPAPPPEWELGTPDHVVILPEYTVPEDIVGELREVSLTVDVPAGRWVVASQVRPGNAYAVRGLYAATLGAAYQPGQAVTRYPSQYAALLKPGEPVAVSLHYVKDEGVAETDQSSIGLYFAADGALPRAVMQAPMRAGAFTIPAGKADLELSVSFTFREDGEVLALMPNMHERGRRVSYALRTPEGNERTLLAISEWNPKWKYRYMLREPIAAPKGSIVIATAIFDNSEANLKNLDPWSNVESGPSGETFEGWLSYALADAPP